MASVKRFVFNPFQENTYVLYDHTRECVIIDPGMYDRSEEQQLSNFIEKQQLIPVKLLNTHCHIDHIMGNRFVKDTYRIPFYIHQLETENLERAPLYGSMFGVKVPQQPVPDYFLKHNEELSFGHTTLRVLFTPGHSAGGVCFYCASDNFIISGDVLFQRSIGRTDLPGGDYHTLIRSIQTHLLSLNDDVVVFSGHGPETTIGEERIENPFLN